MQTCNSVGGCEEGDGGLEGEGTCEMQKTEDSRTQNAGFQFLFNQKALISSEPPCGCQVRGH